ncbi:MULTISPECIES: cupin domain-containing protein [Pseudonocardia]|uniref:Cupin domain protein n=2 Tax=Pseudonocardia TaxID=1847 RepID=A0A1Y2MK99_PSEAH|nr:MULTISPECIES: cupin domain-containing protein [Pseudonocardia]OSY35674.1 Cupin domain protein [Pseudonocardia autotrophica]TDN75716.1 quercetin dioxygenase-like cupin family protein [Pseudonocardia autotrophica]BBF99685.1 hypothetical protein Pdca_08950 [Pseudonocardia autotrophica]GEC29740.1 hypothetical protein PSA01_67690 [Pseudonocardia saturnea]
MAVPRFPATPDVPEIDCSDQPMFVGRVRARFARPGGRAGDLTVLATTFDPGAGTVWHSHDTDQVLVLTAGAGLVDYDDGDTVPLTAGDTVVVDRGRRHRHLADAAEGMTHLSVTGPGESHLLG